LQGKKIEKRILKYLFNTKNENLGVEKKHGGREEKNSKNFYKFQLLSNVFLSHFKNVR
jgi:hypothetical protein